MNGAVPLKIFPTVAVEGCSTMFPAGVTVVSSVPMRLALSFTAVLTALKLSFTSEAFAVVPAVKVVSGPTGPAWPICPKHTVNAPIAKAFRFAFIRALLIGCRYSLPHVSILSSSCPDPRSSNPSCSTVVRRYYSTRRPRRHRMMRAISSRRSSVPPLLAWSLALPPGRLLVKTASIKSGNPQLSNHSSQRPQHDLRRDRLARHLGSERAQRVVHRVHDRGRRAAR